MQRGDAAADGDDYMGGRVGVGIDEDGEDQDQDHSAARARDEQRSRLSLPTSFSLRDPAASRAAPFDDLKSSSEHR